MRSACGTDIQRAHCSGVFSRILIKEKLLLSEKHTKTATTKAELGKTIKLMLRTLTM